MKCRVEYVQSSICDYNHTADQLGLAVYLHNIVSKQYLLVSCMCAVPLGSANIWCQERQSQHQQSLDHHHQCGALQKSSPSVAIKSATSFKHLHSLEPRPPTSYTENDCPPILVWFCDMCWSIMAKSDNQQNGEWSTLTIRLPIQNLCDLTKLEST